MHDCADHHHGHVHEPTHDDTGSRRGRSLLLALALNVGITVVQIVGGVISGSLSILADAAHNASDAAALGISWFAWKISRRSADERHTFGYRRAETIGALINLTTLFVIAAYLLYAAVNRFIHPQEVGGWTMIIVGTIAAAEDAVSAWLLAKDRGNTNVRAAFLHMIADTIATVGVIVGGVLILLFGISWVDPLITAAIAIYIFVHGAMEIRHVIALLMESAPPGFDFAEMIRAVEAMDGVDDLHHVHVWRPDEARLAMDAHLAVTERDLERVQTLKSQVKQLLRERFGVDHATLEVEFIGAIAHDRELLRAE